LREIGRWSFAVVLATCTHVSAAWVALDWDRSEVVPNDPPAAVMIELAPLTVAPPVPQKEVAPGPLMTEAEARPTTETVEPVEETETKPTTTESEQKPVRADDLSSSPDPVPELPQMEKAEAVLTPSMVPPKPAPKKKPPAKPKKTDRDKPKKPKERQAAATTAPPTITAPRAPVAMTRRAAASTTPSESPATWRSALLAHLNRYKRFPPGGAGGTAQVVFTVNRAGNVLASRLVRSSGDTALDQEAVAMMHRASPVPPPPPEMGGNVTLVVPVHFDR